MEEVGRKNVDLILTGNQTLEIIQSTTGEREREKERERESKVAASKKRRQI